MSPLVFSLPSFAGSIGVARIDISPPVAIYSRNWGAAQHDVADGIHRPFTATVLTLQSSREEPPLVLVALDAGWWRRPEDEWVLRGALIKELGLNETRVMINLSHTHAGASLCPDDVDKPGGELIAPYLKFLSESVTQAARSALQSAQPATLEWREGRCGLASNRDLADPSNPRWVCGFNPQEKGDDTLLVGRVCDANGQVTATIVNYACHPTTLAWENRWLSPDFVGSMHETIENQTQAPCLFLQGASGELAPREQYSGDVALADRHGRELGFAALSLLEGMTAPGQNLKFEGVMESGAPLAIWKSGAREASTRLEAFQVEVELFLKDMPSAHELETQLSACTDRVQGERLRRAWHIRRAVGDGNVTSVPLWVWRVGEAVLVGQRNEAYSHLQRELRAAFPDLAVIVMNLVNGSTGYLPPAPFYERDIYPVWQTPYAAGGLEHLIEKARDAIRSQDVKIER